jgi:hypothetical protein
MACRPPRDTIAKNGAALRCSQLAQLLVFKADDNALIIGALAAGLQEDNPTDLARISDMCSTIGLQV